MALVHTRGAGAYQQTQEPWTWLFYPPPYQFADPLPIAPPPGFYAPPEEMGFSGSGCGCGGGCGCHGGAAGAADASNNLGWKIAAGVLAAVVAYNAFK